MRWYSYPAIAFLIGSIRSNHRVLEFGDGHSTQCYDRHAREVIAVDHNPGWVSALMRRAPDHVRVVLGEASSETGTLDEARSPYISAVRELASAPVDLVVVDGMERNACALAAPSFLHPGGILLIDNSDRPAYRPGLQALESAGYNRVDFVGPIPGYGHLGRTSLLFKDAQAAFPEGNHPEFLGY